MTEKKREILLLGGAGYIGQETAKRLLQDAYSVRVLDSFIHSQSLDPALSASSDFACENYDINDPSRSRELISGFDSYVILAGLVGDPACASNPELARKTNFESPLRILDELLDQGEAGRFVFISTDSCYGKRPGEILTEESPLKPVSYYAELKASFEETLFQKTKGSLLTPIVLRLATVYGLAPRTRFDLAVNLLVREAVVKGAAGIYSGEQWRPLVHVRDVAKAVSLALSSPRELVEGQIFNVGSNNQNIRFSELGKLIAECVPDAEVKIIPGAPDLRDYYVSFDKIRKRLGFVPDVSLKDGVMEIRDALKGGLIADPYHPVYRNA
ncbi:MAG: NAD(P)-dependent oxidoreductase [Deltaproteobacteria bacterium]|jgi:nucleoside-diphosphate-sugar epimerase|nr:NAD(P)-dependent oxidoreductase [Deltaproteobacteria bacterium]